MEKDFPTPGAGGNTKEVKKKSESVTFYYQFLKFRTRAEISLGPVDTTTTKVTDDSLKKTYFTIFDDFSFFWWHLYTPHLGVYT